MTILAGQVIARRLIDQNADKGTPSHAYLFEGPDGTGKLDAACYFAIRLNQSPAPDDAQMEMEIQRVKAARDPDIQIIAPDGASIRIEQMRDMIKDLQMGPYKGKRKVMIIQDAEKMSQAAANSILKILEEPASYAVIILITAFPELILSTIRSRCQIIPFRPISAQAMMESLESRFSMDPVSAHLIAGLAEGLPAKGIEIAENPELLESRNEVYDTISQLRTGSKKSIIALIRGYERDRMLEDKIRLWSTVIRDLYIWRMTGDQELLYHRDRVDFYAGIRYADLYGMINFLEKAGEAIRMLERNINSGLVVNYLFGEMDKIFKKEESDG